MTAKKKRKAVKKKKRAPKKAPSSSQVVVPLLPSPGMAPPVSPEPQKGQQRVSIWYLLRGTTIGGLFCIGLGTLGFLFYLRTDKDHPPETALLWVAVGFIAFGFHLVSRQSVRNFFADIGRFLPGAAARAANTAEQPAAPPAGGGGV